MAVRIVPFVQKGYPNSEFRLCGKFLGHTANLCGGGPMQPIDPTQWKAANILEW